MPIHDLNHVNIRAPQPLLDEIKDFYVDVVGLKQGERPNAGIAGYWLYAGDRAIVHLMDSAYRGLDENALSPGTSHLDHFAMTCTDIEGMEAHLQGLNADYRRRDSPEYGFSQLILKDPTGMGVELNFPHSGENRE